LKDYLVEALPQKQINIVQTFFGILHYTCFCSDQCVLLCVKKRWCPTFRVSLCVW